MRPLGPNDQRSARAPRSLRSVSAAVLPATSRELPRQHRLAARLPVRRILDVFSAHPRAVSAVLLGAATLAPAQAALAQERPASAPELEQLAAEILFGHSAVKDAPPGASAYVYGESQGHRAWFASDWFVAARRDGGDPANNLWAAGGPLDKLDQLEAKRGMLGEARELESRPPLGSGVRGGALLGNHLDERDLDWATQGEISRSAFGVPRSQIVPPISGVDFVDANGRWRTPDTQRGEHWQVMLDGKPVAHTRSTEGGREVIRLFAADGSPLSARDASRAFFAPVDAAGRLLSDGRLQFSMDAAWWGSCDLASAAALIFEAPQRSVTLNGVTFTPRDIAGLLTMIVGDVKMQHDALGERYQPYRDEVELKDGRRFRGEVLSPLEPFKAVPRFSGAGDFHVLSSWSAGELTIKLTSGESKTFAPDQIKSAAVQLGEDIPPWLLGPKVVEMAQSGGGAADVDPFDPIYNRPFRAASYSRYEAPPPWAPAEPAVEAGQRREWGEIQIHYGDRTRVHRYSAVYRGEDPIAYRYFDRDANADPPPDFLWRPKQLTFDWPARSSRNPGVDVALVKEIYLASMK